MIHGQTTINNFPATGISGLTQVTAVGADHFMIHDATDSALKKALVSDVLETATSISTSADAVALTFDSSENATFTGAAILPDGSASAPSLTNTGDTDTGLLFSAANKMQFTAGGTAQVTFEDGAIVPVTDNDIDLGTSSLEFKDGYFDGTLYADAIDLAGTALTAFNTDAAQVFNESGAAVDFRIEGDTEQNLLFVDGSADKIGVATSSPAETLDVSGNALLSGSDGTLRKLTFGATGGNHGSIGVDASGHTFVDVETAGGVLYGKIGGNERLKLQDSGPVLTITEAGSDGYEDMLKLVRTHASSTGAGLGFHLTGSGGTAQSASIYTESTEDWSSGTSRSSVLSFQAKDDGTDQLMMAFGNFSDGVNQHKFYTEGAERLRIDQNGVILIGTTSAVSNSKVTVHGGDMMVKGDNNSCGISDLLPGYTRGDYGVVHSTANHVYFSVGSSYVSYINGGNGTFNVSDQRLKENVATLTGTLDKVKQLRGVSFTWKDTEERGTGTAIGLIAQEVEAVYPQLVDDGGLPKDNDGNDPLKSVNYAHLTSVLIEAVKELSTELDAAKARITTLEG